MLDLAWDDVVMTWDARSMRFMEGVVALNGGKRNNKGERDRDFIDEE